MRSVHRASWRRAYCRLVRLEKKSVPHVGNLNNKEALAKPAVLVCEVLPEAATRNISIA